METSVKIVRSPKQPTVTRVLVVEEYGFRHWWWEHPGSITEVVSDWEAGNGPTQLFRPDNGVKVGTLTEIETEEGVEEAYEFDDTSPVSAHVHENTDTSLSVKHDNGEVTYHYPPGYKTTEQVLEEEAARKAKNAAEREELVKSISPEDLLIYAMAYIDSFEVSSGFTEFVKAGGKRYYDWTIPGEPRAIDGGGNLLPTCEKCGHECGEDCTNCAGMNQGESICSICAKARS